MSSHSNILAGHIATIRYLSNGNKNFPKERIEVFSAGKIGILDDFRTLELVSESSRKNTQITPGSG